MVGAHADEAGAFVLLGPAQRRLEVLDALYVLAVASEALRDQVPANLPLRRAERPAVQRELVGLLHRPRAFGEDNRGDRKLLAGRGLHLHDVEACLLYTSPSP